MMAAEQNQMGVYSSCHVSKRCLHGIAQDQSKDMCFRTSPWTNNGPIAEKKILPMKSVHTNNKYHQQLDQRLVEALLHGPFDPENFLCPLVSLGPPALFDKMLARCGERNSSLTRTRASADALAAGVLLAPPQWTRESGVSSETQARLSAFAGRSGTRLFSFGLLDAVALLSAHPRFCVQSVSQTLIGWGCGPSG